MGKRQEERKLKRMFKETADNFGVSEEGVEAYFNKLIEAGISPGFALLSTNFKAQYNEERLKNYPIYNDRSETIEYVDLLGELQSAGMTPAETKKEEP